MIFLQDLIKTANNPNANLSEIKETVSRFGSFLEDLRNNINKLAIDGVPQNMADVFEKVRIKIDANDKSGSLVLDIYDVKIKDEPPPQLASQQAQPNDTPIITLVNPQNSGIRVEDGTNYYTYKLIVDTGSDANKAGLDNDKIIVGVEKKSRKTKLPLDKDTMVELIESSDPISLITKQKHILKGELLDSIRFEENYDGRFKFIASDIKYKNEGNGNETLQNGDIIIDITDDRGGLTTIETQIYAGAVLQQFTIVYISSKDIPKESYSGHAVGGKLKQKSYKQNGGMRNKFRSAKKNRVLVKKRQQIAGNRKKIIRKIIKNNIRSQNKRAKHIKPKHKQNGVMSQKQNKRYR